MGSLCLWDKQPPALLTCLRSSTEPARSSLCLCSSSSLCTVPCISPGNEDGTHEPRSDGRDPAGAQVRPHSPVGSRNTAPAPALLLVRVLIITAMLGTLFFGSCFRAACTAQRGFWGNLGQDRDQDQDWDWDWDQNWNQDQDRDRDQDWDRDQDQD